MENVIISGSLKLLEPSGPFQACTGIALPLYRDEYQTFYIVHAECGHVSGNFLADEGDYFPT
jgi:hypothetical protein